MGEVISCIHHVRDLILSCLGLQTEKKKKLRMCHGRWGAGGGGG